MQTDYFAFHNAWVKFRNGKKPSPSIDEFAYNLEANLEELAIELQQKATRLGFARKGLVLVYVVKKYYNMHQK